MCGDFGLSQIVFFVRPRRRRPPFSLSLPLAARAAADDDDLRTPEKTRKPQNKQTKKQSKKKAPDEIVLPKSSSSPFASTPLEYLLRALGRDQLLVCGALTDQCVSSTVREAADRGLRVTLAADACVGSSAKRHEEAIDHVKGYCRVRTAAECASELLGGGGGAPPSQEEEGGSGGATRGGAGAKGAKDRGGEMNKGD